MVRLAKGHQEEHKVVGKVAVAVIQAGICQMVTRVRAEGDDSYGVRLAIESDCDKVRAFAAALAGMPTINALDEITRGHEGVVLSAARTCLKGCCAACVTAPGVFKAMQVAAGLALPADVQVRLQVEG